MVDETKIWTDTAKVVLYYQMVIFMKVITYMESDMAKGCIALEMVLDTMETGKKVRQSSSIHSKSL